MEILLTLLPFACIASFTPGPNNILVMSCGISHGLKATLPYQMGAGGACFIITVLCIWLSATLEQVLPAVLPVMRYAGCAYMLWLALVVAKAPPPEEKSLQFTGIVTWRSGFLLQFLNPKFYLYTMTLATMLGPVSHSLSLVLFFGLFYAFIAVAGMFLWAAAGAVLQRFLRRWHRVSSVVMGLLLVYCAFSLFEF